MLYNGVEYDFDTKHEVIFITNLEYDGIFVAVQYDLSNNTFFGIFGVNSDIVVVENASFPKLQKEFMEQVERINSEL